MIMASSVIPPENDDAHGCDGLPIGTSVQTAEMIPVDKTYTTSISSPYVIRSVFDLHHDEALGRCVL